MTCSPKTLADLQIIAAAGNEALAEDIVAIDVTGHLPFSDAFMIMTADNPRHLRSVISAVSAAVKQEDGRLPINVEGDQDSDWVLMNFDDVVVHIFLPEAREFYGLETLWGSSPRIAVEVGEEAKTG